MTSPRTRYDFGLSPLHIRALAAMLLIAAVAVGISTRNRIWFGDSVPVEEAKVAAGREFLDPNTASAASLERLPGVGPTRAAAVVQYRQAHPTAPFVTAGDVQKIHGVGEGTVRKISPYLTLPCER
jgi:competence ComEA-like helix-hairpin-helix protein